MRTAANPRTVIAAKSLEYLGLVMFTTIAPRVMGPENFGTFAAVLAIVGLFATMTGLGAMTTFGRFIPEYVERDDRVAVSRLFTQLLAVRMVMVVPLGIVVVVLVARLLPELGPGPPLLAAGTFMISAVGMTGFQLSYGLNRLGRSQIRWALSRLLLASGILMLGPDASPSVAILLLFIIEGALGLVGLGLAASFVLPGALSSGLGEVRDALRFGAAFFGAALLLTAVWRGGEIAVATLSDGRAEIAFYSIASVIVMALAQLLTQVSTMPLPTFTGLHLRGEHDLLNEWLANTLRYMTLLAVMAVIGIFTVGDRLLPVILGEGFTEVAANLKILAVGLVPFTIVRTATTLAVITTKGREAVLIGATGLGAFLVLAVLAVPVGHSRGASIAVSASFFAAALQAVLRMRMSPILTRARYWRVVAPGAVLLVLLILVADPLMAGGLALVAYPVAAAWLGVLRIDEVRAAVTTMLSGSFRGRT